MRSAQKKTPASEKKNGKEQTSGKKLVQARLPFKIVAGTAASSSLDDGSVVQSEVETLPKKRKLSYEDQSGSPNKKIGKSDSKENSSKPVKDNKDVIILDDDEPDTDSEPKTPTSVKVSKRMKKSTPNSANKSNAPKVQIKLPLSGKKKRKKVDLTPKTKTTKQQVDDSSDVEIIDEGNITKKIKLSEDTTSEKINNDQESIAEEIPQTKSPNKKTETEILPTKISPADKDSNNLEMNTSDMRSRLRNKNTDLQNSPKKKDLQIESTDKETPPRQKNLKISVKRIRTPKKTDNKKDKTEDSNATGEEISLSPNLENGENLNCEEISLSDTDGELDKSIAANTSTSSLSKKVLTPKQLKLIENRKKAREEKERKLAELKEEKNRKLQEQREERERKLQEEKLQKQKEREERELQRKKEREEKDEQKRKEKEEKEEQRRKEKEDKERKRLAEVEAKNEEKRKRDEAKEEERRKKDEERRRKELEKEEEENKKKKAAQAFTKFFVPKAVKSCADEDQESKEDVDIIDCLAFRPFQVKGDMKLAPLVRREFKKSSREKLDSSLNYASESKNCNLYLTELKRGSHIPLKSSKTVLKDNDDDILVIEDELETAAEAISEARPKTFEKCRAKFLFFHENRRPPYYGTWRKKSYFVTARRPFATDKVWFDYEIDSDDEWEEEEPGESLNGSEDEKEESEDDDYEVDNEWFVPHGHLSDEELQNEDELGPDTSREAQKAKLKALQQEFAQEMKKKTEKIKPRLFGAIWEDENGNKPKLCPDIIWQTLCARAMIVCETPIVEEPAAPEREPSTPPPEKQKRLEINDDLMVDLIRLVHGNRNSRAFLIKEYIEHVRKTCEKIKSGECLAPTKSLIKEKIDEISEWSVLDDVNSKKKRKKLCWVVPADILKKYALENLGLQNEWSYTLPPKFDSANETLTGAEIIDEYAGGDKLEESKPDGNRKKKSCKSSITKFAKVLTSEEKNKILSKPLSNITESAHSGLSKSAQKALPEKDANDAKTTCSTTPAVKKRVALLMSVPTGQDFPTKSKNALISKFLEANKPKTSSAKPDANVNSYLQSDRDGVVIIE